MTAQVIDNPIPKIHGLTVEVKTGNRRGWIYEYLTYRDPLGLIQYWVVPHDEWSPNVYDILCRSDRGRREAWWQTHSIAKAAWHIIMLEEGLHA